MYIGGYIKIINPKSSFAMMVANGLIEIKRGGRSMFLTSEIWERNLFFMIQGVSRKRKEL